MFGDENRSYEDMTPASTESGYSMNKSPEDYFNEHYLPGIKTTFEEVTDMLRDKYVSGKADNTDIEMYIDSVWILAKRIDHEWTVDFGLGKNKK